MTEEFADVTPALDGEVRRVHPLLHAGKWLLADLLSTLIFVGLYAATRNTVLATTVAIGLGFAQIAYLKVRSAQIDAMQWLSIGLVVIFGCATLLTNNPVFVMLKLTLIYSAVGIVMLKRGWMTRYLSPLAQARAGDLTTVFGYIWAALMFATAAGNLAFALFASTATLVWFVAVFPAASKSMMVGIQYAVTRRIVRRRLRAAQPAAVPAAI